MKSSHSISEPLQQNTYRARLEFVMDYQFDPLIHRMIDKYGWEELETRECFEDMKRYLCLAAQTGKPLVPSPRIDEIWHNFILFTMDYSEFCLTKLGRFIHHRPRRRDDEPSRGNHVGLTIRLAQEFFGTLSANWNFPGLKMEAQCTCSNWCQCS
ncbi:hypothetical protein EPO05_06195 [Patescibacteria group bacterium]|nr:MAG: hypothetical protein EPO05_06195 [Patescibacteria group bacterium]